MVDPQLVARLRQEPYAMQPMGCDDAASLATPLCSIETLPSPIGSRARGVLPEATQTLAHVPVARGAGPSRDEIAEAIEDVCGEELSGCCVNRIDDAGLKLCRAR